MPRKPKSLLVFDLDGVLVDVRRSYPRAVVATVAALGGGRVRAAEMRRLKELGGFNNDWDLSLELLRRRGRRCRRAEVVAVFNRLYLGEAWNGLIRNERWLLPAPGLEALAERYRLAIFTGRPRAFAAFTLRHFGVRRRFADLVTLEDVRRGKPAPDGLRLLARRHGSRAIAAYVGDLIDDARCARAAAIPFLGIAGARSGGARTRALRAAGAARVERSVADAVPWLLGLDPARAG